MKRAVLRGLVVLATLSLVTMVASCDPPDETTDGGATHECSVPRDCGAGFDCIMGDDGFRVCVKLFCTTDSDCDQAAGEHCDRRRGMCLGDICRPGVEGSCPAGKVCLGGTCTDPPPPADSCELAPDTVVVRSGETALLNVTGYMSSGALAPLAAFNWASDTEACATVAEGVVTGNAGAGSTCTATITASPVGGGTSCTATVTTFPPVPATELRALVLDEFQGTPISGVQLLVRTDDGAGGPVTELAPVTTDASGVASVADLGTSAAGNILDVSAFHMQYAYVTVVRPGTNDLIFFLREVMDDTTMAGVKSVEPNGIDFSQVHTQGDIKIGIAGMSIPGSLTDLDFMQLLGETVERDISLEGVGDFDGVPLPSGIYLELAAASVKSDFQAFGEPGKRILWGLGGRVKLADIGPIISDVAGGEGDLEVGGILQAVLPYFGTFDHAIISGIDLVEVPRPQDGSEPNTWDFGTDEQQLVVNTLLSQSADYTIPTMPANPGGVGYVSGAVVLLGAIVPGQGTVPLGLTAGLDAPEDTDPEDGILDPMACPENDPGCEQPAKGKVIVDFAPPHSGMEGSPYMTVAMALGLDSIGDAASTSVVIDIQESIGDTNTFPSNTFLEFPTGGSYVEGVSYQQTAPLPGADFYRLNLDVNDHGWQVYFNDAVTGVSLPTPPGGLEARVEEADIQSFQTFGAGAFGVSELFAFNGTNLNDLLWLTAAFSTLQCVSVEQPQQGSCDADDDYTQDTDTGLCVGGPNDITAFAAGTASPCGGMSGYEPVYTSGSGSAGICAKTPACLKN